MAHSTITCPPFVLFTQEEESEGGDEEGEGSGEEAPEQKAPKPKAEAAKAKAPRKARVSHTKP